MKIINGERASGKTDGLIMTAYATGARILTPTPEMARFIENRAKERGISIETPMQYKSYLDGPGKFLVNDSCPIIIDEAEKIIEDALEARFKRKVIAVTITEPQIKTLFPERVKETEKDSKP